MNNILEKINSATSSEINELISALLRRYSSLFPDWEIAFLSFPKGNSSDNKEQLNTIIDFLANLRDNWIVPPDKTTR